ncbi:hypothetical protein M0R45_015475 [Rubus argutus]|uniref:Uncharacterized protein n=1 Tax=Rubus argutus TaxID=59490 RepID=A0AAW1XQ79_RUBAR
MGCAGLIDGELSAVDIDGTVAEIRDGADSYDVGEARQSLGWCGGEQRDATGSAGVAEELDGFGWACNLAHGIGAGMVVDRSGFDITDNLERQRRHGRCWFNCDAERRSRSVIVSDGVGVLGMAGCAVV